MDVTYIEAGAQFDEFLKAWTLCVMSIKFDGAHVTPEAVLAGRIAFRCMCRRDCWCPRARLSPKPLVAGADGRAFHCDAAIRPGRRAQ
jgi:hypothetical protein